MVKLEPMLTRVMNRVRKLEWEMISYTIDGGALARAPISKLESWLEVKMNPEDLRNWLSYQKTKENCERLGLMPFLTVAKENQIPAQILEDAFMLRLWKAWLAEAYRESPALADFVATSHERIIQDFQNIDKDLKELTIKLVRQNIAKSQPKAEAAVPGTSQMGEFFGKHERNAWSCCSSKTLRGSSSHYSGPQALHADEPTFGGELPDGQAHITSIG